MSDPHVPQAGSFEEATSRLVRAWARVTTRVWRNVLDLSKLPLELGAREDRSLGVWHTTVFFPPPGTGNVRLRCTSITKHPSTDPIDVRVMLDPSEYPGTTTGREIRITLPRDGGPGLYRFTLEDEDSGEAKMYTLPFGIPGS